MSESPTSRRLDLLAGLWVAYALLVARFWFVCDDAWISFRYARNLANGIGLRFNPGDAAPVEGYSNFLWVLAASGVEWLNADVSLWMPLFSALCGALLVAGVFERARSSFGLTDTTAAITALSVALFPPLALWASGGLETLPFSLALFLLFDELILREAGPRVGRALALGLLVAGLRVEGVLWVGAISALSALQPRGETSEPPARGALVRFGLLFALGFAAYEVWRIATFGDWLPNTVRAKASLSPELLKRGFDYTAVYFLTFLTPFLMVPASLATLGGQRARLAIPLVVMAWAFPVYAILTSGDFMAMGRFLVPGVPYAALVGGTWLTTIGRGGDTLRRLASAIALCVVGVALLPAFDVHLVPESVRARHHFRHSAPAFRSELAQWRFMRDNARKWQALGEVAGPFARATWGEEASLVATAIGAVGYHSGLVIYDQAGLVSREVALLPTRAEGGVHRSPGHDRQVGSWFFLDRNPSLLRATWIEAEDEAGLLRDVAASAKELVRVLPERAAWTQYVPHLERIDTTPHAAVLFWRRISSDQPWQAAWQEFAREFGELPGSARDLDLDLHFGGPR